VAAELDRYSDEDGSLRASLPPERQRRGSASIVPSAE
jgi:hypothetical protein